MNAKELTVKHMEFMTRYEMNLDTTELIEGSISIHEILINKDIDSITDVILEPLFKEYSECDNNSDREDIIEYTRSLLDYLKG